MQEKREQKMLSVRIPSVLFHDVRVQAAVQDQAVQAWVQAALERALAVAKRSSRA